MRIKSLSTSQFDKLSKKYKKIYDDHPNKYNSPVKVEAREWIIKKWNEHNKNPPTSIFTLPSKDGYCIKQFKGEWESIKHITGNEIDRKIFKLCSDNLHKISDPATFDYHNIKFSGNMDIGKFDLCFVDLMTKPDNNDIFIDFQNNHLNENGMIFVTYAGNGEGFPSEDVYVYKNKGCSMFVGIFR